MQTHFLFPSKKVNQSYTLRASESFFENLLCALLMKNPLFTRLIFSPMAVLPCQLHILSTLILWLWSATTSAPTLLPTTLPLTFHALPQVNLVLVMWGVPMVVPMVVLFTLPALLIFLLLLPKQLISRLKVSMPRLEVAMPQQILQLWTPRYVSFYFLTQSIQSTLSLYSWYSLT